ncbi:MAG: site-specific DNA-methyltransferase [bacterium]|nr:site-specific DNA-methyltransferase [bacterium]
MVSEDLDGLGAPLLADPTLTMRYAPGRLPMGMTGNHLIHAENRVALEALLPTHRGRVRLVYADPPYNTGRSHAHFEDRKDSSEWLEQVGGTLVRCWDLLEPGGFLAVQIDDREFARLYLWLAHALGEERLKTVVVKMAEPTGVKMAQVVQQGSLPRLKEYLILAGKSGVKGLVADRVPKGRWDAEYRWVLTHPDPAAVPRLRQLLSEDDALRHEGLAEVDAIARGLVLESLRTVSLRERGVAPDEAWCLQEAWRIVRTVATTPAARKVADRKRDEVGDEAACFVVRTTQGRHYLIRNGYDRAQEQPRIRILFADDHLTVHPGDFWDDIRTTGLDKEGGVTFRQGKKPEALLRRVVHMTTRPGDLVLDPYGGSGTTAAVAHKMGRRWILVEQGDQCRTHCLPRLSRVIAGDDSGGITARERWTGGGGFHGWSAPPERDRPVGDG